MSPLWRDLTKVVSNSIATRDSHVPTGNRIRASAVGGEDSSKKLFEQPVNSYSEHLHKLATVIYLRFLHSSIAQLCSLVFGPLYIVLDIICFRNFRIYQKRSFFKLIIYFYKFLQCVWNITYSMYDFFYVHICFFCVPVECGLRYKLAAWAVVCMKERPRRRNNGYVVFKLNFHRSAGK
jgi:hypothetical protein